MPGQYRNGGFYQSLTLGQAGPTVSRFSEFCQEAPFEAVE